MATTSIDLSGGMVPKQGGGGIDLSAGLVSKGSSLDLSNSQGQGLYQMTDKSGKVAAVPYGQVQQAAQLGYGFTDDATNQRFNRDASADHNRTQPLFSSGMTPAESQARAQQIEKNSSLPMQIVGGVAKGAGTLARPVLNAMDYATTGNTQDVGSMLEARTPAQRVGKYATIAAVATPAAIAAPLATVGGVIGGTVGAGAGQVIGKATGMSPGATDVLSDTLGLAGGAGGAMGARPLVSALNFNAQKQAAGALLQSVAHDANKIPVQLDNSGDSALRLMDWQRKTNLGPTLNKFLNRITNPNQGPLTYEEGRDFYQLLGNMSANDKMNLPPTVMRDVTTMLAGLKTDIGNAAGQVGHAADYYQGLGDYARASKYQGWYDAAKDFAAKEGVKAAVKGAGVGIGGTAAYKLWQWFTEK